MFNPLIESFYKGSTGGEGKEGKSIILGKNLISNLKKLTKIIQ